MDSYRGITNRSIFSKTYLAIWERRLTDYVETDNLRSNSQFGFRKHVGTLCSRFILRHLIHRQRAPLAEGGNNRSLYVGLMDLQSV